MTLPVPTDPLSFVKALDFRYDGKPHALTSYDLSNVRAIADCICGDGGDRVILGPASSVTLLLGSVVAAIALLDRSVRSQSEAMYKSLTPGDIVRLDGRCGEYLGIDDYKDCIQPGPRLRIRFSDLIHAIRLDQAWRLTKGTPGRRRLDRSDKSVRQSTEPLFVLQELLKIPRNRIPPAFKVKLPVVVATRQVIDHYSHMSLGENACATVLPAAYFTQENRYERIGHDPYKREPVICFSSNMEVAATIARNHSEASGLLIGDPRKLKGNLSRIRDLQGANKSTVVLAELPTVDMQDLSNLAAAGFEVQSWGSSAIKRAYAPARASQRGVSSDPFIRRDQVLRNVATGASCTITVESPEGEQAIAVMSDLKMLSKSMTRSDEFRRFFGIAYGFLMDKICLPLPEEQVKLLGYNDGERLERLGQLAAALYTTASEESAVLLQRVYLGIIRCWENHRQFHPKHEAFKRALGELQAEDCIVVRGSTDQRILKSWLGPNTPVRVLTLRQALNADHPVRNCLTLGYYGQNHVKLRYGGFCSAETIIGYPFELEQTDKGLRYMQKQLQRLAAPKYAAEDEPFETAPLDLEGIVRSFEAEWERSLVDRGFADPGDGSDTEGIPVVFEEDYVAFLAPGYNCRCLDEEQERITVKKVSEIRRGDSLVFVKDSAEDIFDRLTETIKRNSPKLMEQVYLTQLWKRAFSDYLKTNRVSVGEFQKRLRKAGVNRTTATIRAWGKKDCIGPEEDALRALSLVVEDPELTARLEEVMDACRKMRALHITLGRYLAKAIVSSAASGASVDDELMLGQIVDDLSLYAEVVTVLEVGKRYVKVPSGQANRLLNKFY